MKKIKLSFLLYLSFFSGIFAQQTLKVNEGLIVKNKAAVLPFTPEFRNSEQQNFFKFENAYSNNLTSGNSEPEGLIEPSATITSRTWGQLTNFDDGTYQLYQMNYQFGTGANVAVKLLDKDIAVTDEFSFEIPTTTNSLRMITQYSSFDLNGNTNKKFMIFLHYFEGGTGPDYQKNAVWVVDSDGNILHKFIDVTGTFFLNSPDGSTDILSYINDDTNVILKIYDTETLLPTKTLQEDSQYFINYMGVPLSFIEIDGAPKVVLVHYEKKYMDNNTLEVTPDNHMLIKILDNALNLEKQVAIPIPEVPTGTYVFGLGEFGMFYGDNKYDITKNIFNTDEQLEFLYAINYQDLINDKSWRNYFVADENGNTIKSLEESIISYSEMNEIEGNEDQISFILGDGSSGSSIKMFDIPSWTTVFDFPAVYNDDLLSVYYNRIPYGDSYQFLIGLGYAEQDGSNYYGIVNKYSKEGELQSNIRLNLGTAPLSFTPLLYTDTLNPHVYNTDDEYEFSYVYSFKYPGNNTTYNSFNAAKNNVDPFFTANGDSTKGNLRSSGFLLDENGIYYKLYMNYTLNYTSYTTDFYDLPMNTLAVSEAQGNMIKAYTDQQNQQIGFTGNVNSYTVYNAVGSVVTEGNGSVISTFGWPKGVYYIQFKTVNNILQSQKVLIR